MALYEVVREIQNECANNQMRDVFFDEVETDDPVQAVREMLRDEKDRFLDDLTAKQLGEALGCEIEVIPTDGAGGCKAYLGELKPKPKRKKLHFSFGGR